MATDTLLTWQFDCHAVTVGTTRVGSGPLLLLLPAPSSISTRREMLGLQERLAASFETLAVDWPGFGELPRPPVAWHPEMLTQFLVFLRGSLASAPVATIAAGHAAAYVLAASAAAPLSFGTPVLIAPTWRGPLPTMAGGQRPLFARLRRAMAVPLLGPALYHLNVNTLSIKMMGRGHVYADRSWLSGAHLDQKLAVTAPAGARFASAAFVTGGLDLFTKREDFLAAAAAAAPLVQLFGEATPRKSRAEMEALAGVPGVTTVRLRNGKLAVHEEFPDETAHAILDYVAGQPITDG